MINIADGIFTSLKTALDIAQGLRALEIDTAVSIKAAELTNVIIDIQGKMLAAQAEYSTALRRISDLEAEIAYLKRWENEKERYELKALARGTFVYRVKPGMENGEPVHDLCPHCYQQAIKSILQSNGIEKRRHSHICPHCKAVFLTGKPAGGFFS